MENIEQRKQIKRMEKQITGSKEAAQKRGQTPLHPRRNGARQASRRGELLILTLGAILTRVTV